MGWRYAGMVALCLAAPGFGAVAGEGLPAPATSADFRQPAPAEVRLGQLLFWDPILSGNRNIACGTCHNPAFATTDGVSLGLGEGASGLGVDRAAGAQNAPPRRIARNAPALFNLGAKEFVTLFQDGNVEADPTRPSGFRTALEDGALDGVANVLAAQILFPMLSPDEMAGHGEENEVASALRAGRISGAEGAMERIAARLRAIPEYRRLFAAAYPETATTREIRLADAANAIAAFVAVEWRADSAPFDAYLRGTADLPEAALQGVRLFYGQAGCATCHSGPFQTDHGFHAMGAPQLGPGKAEAFEINSRDTGRMRVTRRAEDAYAFRTPSLRMVTETGPWGHAGGHLDLAEFVAYHADPVAGIAGYVPQALLPRFDPAKPDWAVMQSPAEREAIAAAVRTAPRALAPGEIAALMAFLASLTDRAALQGRLGIPLRVPSGLPVNPGG